MAALSLTPVQGKQNYRMSAGAVIGWGTPAGPSCPLPTLSWLGTEWPTRGHRPAGQGPVSRPCRRSQAGKANTPCLILGSCLPWGEQVSGTLAQVALSSGSVTPSVVLALCHGQCV